MQRHVGAAGVNWLLNLLDASKHGGLWGHGVFLLGVNEGHKLILEVREIYIDGFETQF